MAEPLLVLASGSPRRRELLSSLGLTFQVQPADIDETEFPGEDPRAYVLRLAKTKAQHIASQHAPGTVVIGADTTVELDGSILGKPIDAQDAKTMLRSLSGRSHVTHTGIAVAISGTSEDATWTYVSTTEVTFTELTDEIIAWYVGTGEPLDKAGSYGLQGIGGALVASINGNAQNVVGLPLADLLKCPAIQAQLGR